MVLDDTEMLVVHTMSMRLSEKESLAWMASNGVLMKRAQFYRIKARLRSLKDTISETAPNEFLVNNACIFIEQLETIMYLSYQNAIKEKDPLKNQKILESIVGMIPILSAYNESLTDFKKDPILVNENDNGVSRFFEKIM